MEVVIAIMNNALGAFGPVNRAGQTNVNQCRSVNYENNENLK